MIEMNGTQIIPGHLLNSYTLNGRIPIKTWYIDEAYPDSIPIIYTYEQVENLKESAENRNQFYYGATDSYLYDALDHFPIQGMSVAIMGSRTPVYESIVLASGGNPTTIEYNKIISQHPHVNTMTVKEYEENPVLFDAIFSISSYEHDGLGRYGDPLNPNGDLIAMEKTKPMLKKGGLLYLAVPLGKDCLVWNAHRIYGKIRLPMLIDGWEIVGTYGFAQSDYDREDTHQPVFVLRPINFTNRFDSVR